MMLNNYPPQEEVAPVSSIPHNREAEEATVGAVLINPGVYFDLVFLAADDFYIQRHKWIWEAYAKLNEARMPVDLLTVSEELDNAGKLAEIGGSAYLTSLINQVPSSLNAESYARIVEGHAVRRKMIAAANKIASAAYNEGITVEEAQEIANREINTASEDRRNDEADSAKRAMSKVYDRAVKNAELRADGKPTVTGLKTGLIDLDMLLLGIEPQESVIVAAPTGKGKTSFMFDVARHNVLKEKKNVAIFSLEMNEEEVMRRFIAQEAEINSTKIKLGDLSDGEWAKFTNTIELYEASQGKLFLSDIRNLTPAALRAKCMNLNRRFGLDLVIVDYLQLMSSGINMANRALEVGYISRQIKILAGELDVPFISASQFSRSIENRTNKRPTLADLKESSGIEQDANTVIFLHFDEYAENNGVTEAIVAKRRDGATGSVNLIYRKEFTTFRNAATKQFPPKS